MKIRDASLCLLILVYIISAVSANSVHGCGGFLEASSSVIKSRKETDAKLDYSRINVELRTVDGLVKERTQCAPNGYYFIPVYDKALVNVLGTVVCKEKCGASVFVTLVRLAGQRKEGRKIVSLTNDSSQFLFADVLPGKYRLEVKHTSPGAVSKEDNWCLQQSFTDVDVDSEDIEGIKFVQKGYWVNIVSTHDVDAYLIHQDDSLINLKIKLIYLKGEKYLLSGQINVNSSSSNDLPMDIVMDVLNGDGTIMYSTNAKLVSTANDQTRTAVYEYSVWANLGAKLTFLPMDPRNNGEKKLLFYPRLHHPGFYLKQVGSSSFSCQKLGQISVKIYSKDDATELIPSVLLSLSGDDGYRNNPLSGTGGIFVFENLFPGSFYLRPLLKEYAFSPSAQAIELGSGESREVVFHATRVAYSAMDLVTLLSGQPKEGVSIEARSESKGYYEETITDSSGSYRLRGLIVFNQSCEEGWFG